jgi:hypothetical protein
MDQQGRHCGSFCWLLQTFLEKQFFLMVWAQIPQVLAGSPSPFTTSKLLNSGFCWVFLFAAVIHITIKAFLS